MAYKDVGQETRRDFFMSGVLLPHGIKPLVSEIIPENISKVPLQCPHLSSLA